MCIDYRKLNARTMVANFPVPQSDNLLDNLKGCKYFSLLDLLSAYQPISIKKLTKTE